MRLPLLKNNQSGYLMLLIIIMGATFLSIEIAITAASTSNLKASKNAYAALDALSVAEAGADNAVFNLNKDNAYVGTNTSCPISGTGSNPVTFFSDNVKGKGTFETCVTNGTIANEKIIYATGKIYMPTTATTPVSTRRIKIVLIGTFVPGSSYAVHTGPGGLIMSNSATVSNGDVYIGGKITMSNTAKIGSVTTPADVWAGNYVCPQPADSTYPQLCASGSPITLNNSAHIYGTVNANGQSSGNGMTNPGLVVSPPVANSVLPDYDRAGHKAAVASTMTASSASCSNNQTRTWPANVHITGGNVSLSNNCVVTMNGNVWIDGALTLSNQSVLRIANSVSTLPTVMIDGSSGLSISNQGSVSTNTAQIGAQFITFWANSGCSPDCSNLTGTGLANSQNTNTINLSNQGLGSGSVFYARWSKVSINNSGSTSQLMGQTIQMSNSGNITFGSGSGVGGGTYSYAVRYYEQI